LGAIVSDLTKYLVWAAIVAVIFVILWWQGQIKRISAYVAETREELRKCTWPTWDELKGSTVVVTMSIVILGGLTVLIDHLFFFLFFKL